MFGQPRCREWTPLATQQLRLRSLIQIVGYNIHEEDGSTQMGSLYYTLHTTTMSAPFYTSEKLLSNHPKWREIDSELIHKMSSSNVVVRIWKHNRQENTFNPASDTIVQTWGINFNGLLHIGANLALDFSPKSFKRNTLVFQMIGGYFCPYDCLKLEPTMKIPNIELPKEAATMGKEASPSKRIPIDKNNRLTNESKSVSPSKGWKVEPFESRALAKSHSPPVSCFRQSSSGYKSSNSNLSILSRQDYCRSEGRERKRSDSYNSAVYEHSPKSENDIEIREYLGSDESSDALKSCSSRSGSSRELHRLEVEESEQAEDINTDVPAINKCRHLSMKFLNSEIRPSYTAEKLQKLHLLQYMIKKRTEAVQEIKDKIYKKSAIENSDDLSPHGALVDNEDFSRSEKLSMSCREFSLFSGKNRLSSRSLGKLFSDSNLSLQSSVKDLSKINNDGVEESRESVTQSVPPDKNMGNIRWRTPSNKYLANNLEQSDRRFTLPLNKLLEFKSQPSPSQRLRHSQLTRQAELSRFKRRLLQDERDTALAKLRRLHQEKIKIFEDNQDNSTELMQNYHSLSRKAEQLRELKKSEAALKELYQRSTSMLMARRWRLVQDLTLIYPITEDESGCYQILDISLPACKDNADGLKQCSEADLAVALGRVAHLTALAASLLGVPLRHPVRLMGSRTKVLDHLAQENEIPLFARNRDSMKFRYGLFLLNRNIAQLLWVTHRLIALDPRDTLANLKKLLTPPTVTTGLDASRLFGSGSSMETTGTGTTVTGLIHPMSCTSLSAIPSSLPKSVCMSINSVNSNQSLRNMIPKHHHHRPFNRFKDSVDGTSPKAAMMIRKHSRSVGSCAEEQCLQALEIAAGSEPSLLLLDSPEARGEPKPSTSKQENIMKNIVCFSESDLTKVTNMNSSETSTFTENLLEDKVIFSLGEEGDTPDGTKKSPVRYLGKSKSLEQENIVNSTELRELKCDVDRLTKEMEVLCNDCNNQSCHSADKLEDTGNLDAKCLHCSMLSDDFRDVTESNGDCDNIHNVSVISNVSSSCDQTESNLEKNEIVAVSCPAADIECFPPPFCKQPCGTSCPKTKEECPKILKTGYDQCENGQEIMEDVIVYPSAEAVMTTSSHFTDSPLFDSRNREELVSVIDSPINEEELVTLAKRVLIFEDEEMSKSILSALKSSSIENENKTENDITILKDKCTQNTNSDLEYCNKNNRNGDLNSSCHNTKCCLNEGTQCDEHHKTIDNKTNINLLPDESNVTVSNTKRDTSVSLSSNSKTDAGMSGDFHTNAEISQTTKSKQEVNGYR